MELPRLDEHAVSNEEGDDTLFYVEVDSDPDGCANKTAGRNLEPSYSRKCVMSNENAEKLDVMMTVLLEHLQTLCFKDGREYNAACCLNTEYNTASGHVH